MNILEQLQRNQLVNSDFSPYGRFSNRELIAAAKLLKTSPFYDFCSLIDVDVRKIDGFRRPFYANYIGSLPNNMIIRMTCQNDKCCCVRHMKKCKYDPYHIKENDEEDGSI